jgi:predicted HTH domain antitoxin
MMKALGLSFAELQREIEVRMNRMDELQEEEEQLGQYGDLLRMATMIAFQRAAELIEMNNRRIEEQLRAAGIDLNS